MLGNIFSLILLVLAISGTANGTNPEIVDEIWPEVQPLGRTGRLNCTIVRRGHNQVEWKHVNTSQGISMDDGIIIQPNPVEGGLRKYEVRTRKEVDREIYMLVIRRLREQDAGIYECIVRIHNTLPSSWPKKNGYLTVQVPPTIQDSGTTTVLQVERGNNATLKCAATGMPSPNITWTRSNGGFLPVLPKPVMQFRAKELTLVNVNVNHMGVYRCVADNNIKPPAEHLAEVLVFHAPKTRVVQNSVGQIQNQRASALLECIVQGHPEPTVSWLREEKGSLKLLQDSDEYDINKQTSDNQNLLAMESWYSLKVINVMANDYTRFFCRAENDFGVSESMITLFETSECQGANCPSISPSASTSVTASILLTFLLASFVVLYFYAAWPLVSSIFVTFLLACVVVLGWFFVLFTSNK